MSNATTRPARWTYLAAVLSAGRFCWPVAALALGLVCWVSL
jgi:hypothetical protein